MREFSVIICTYNGGKRLGKVLNSIISQMEFETLIEEILVVDNCSTDNTSDIIKQYVQKHDRIKYLFENKPGLSNARLCGVQNCSAKWIIFLDDDNFIQQNWIKSASVYISEHKNVGAFNGNVIPKFSVKLSTQQETLIKVAYLGLACTTYSEDAIVPIDEKEWVPFGAGLVILSKELKKLADVGWLKSEGRKLNKIISGEDTEMTAWVKNRGYDWGFCNNMILYHEIGIHRLDLGYLKELYFSFGVANYVAISQKNFYILRRIKWALIEGWHLINAKTNNWLLRKWDEKYYQGQLSISRAKGYFQCLSQAMLIKK